VLVVRTRSERQRSARRDHVHLVERWLHVGAAAIGIAGAKPPGRDRAGGAAGRVGELAGATDDFSGLLHRQTEQAVVRVEGERGDLPARADEVHGALREDQVVAADVGGVAGQVRDLDDPADAAEHPLATIMLLMTVRVPETPEVTMVPLNVSLPFVAAAAGMAGTAEIASAVPAASSAPVSCRFMRPPMANSVSRREVRRRRSRG